jgi:hypothetical protein
MKKLLGIVVLGLMLSGNTFAGEESWECQKISSKNYKCKTQRDDMKIEYLGEIKNNLPHGKGKFQVLNDDIYVEGTFKKGEHVGGIRIMFGIKMYLENNKKEFKAVYPDGAIFIGKKNVVKIDGKESQLNGTLTLNNGSVFKGSLKHVFEPTPMKGRMIFKKGPKSGDTFNGTFFHVKTFHGPKKGKYIWAKKNNKNQEYFEGEYKISGSKYFASRGVLQFRNGDKYEGSFKDNDKGIKTGIFYSADGAVKKVKNGKFSKSINITNYLNLYSILGLVIISSFLLHLNANKQLYSGEKEFNLVEAIKSFMDTPLGTGIMLLILAIILFKVFNWSSSTDLGKPRFFGHDGG